MGVQQIPNSYAGPRTAVPWWEGMAEAADTKAVYLDADLNGADMLRAMGADWTVRKEPLYFQSDRVEIADGLVAQYAMVKQAQAIVRDTDNAVLGVASPGYGLVQNEVLATLADGILQESDAHFHTGGVLYDGRLVWMLAKFPKDVFVRGDGSPIEDYLAVSTGHDARHALCAFATMTRVVCGNTYNAAEQGARSKVTLRHTVNALDRLDEIRSMLDVHRKYVDTYVEAMNELAKRPMTLDEFTRFTQVLIPENPKAERVATTAEKRDMLIRLFRKSENLDGVDYSAYRALQAVVEYADHHRAVRGQNADRRALSIIEGPAAQMKAEARKLLATA